VAVDLNEEPDTPKARPVRSRSCSADPLIWSWRSPWKHPDRRRGKCSRNQASGITIGIATKSEVKRVEPATGSTSLCGNKQLSWRNAARRSSRLHVQYAGKAHQKQVLDGAGTLNARTLFDICQLTDIRYRIGFNRTEKTISKLVLA